MNAECIVCAYEMDGKERVPSLAACGHNSMCSLCTLRIRALHRNVNCVTCKRELEHVICSDKPEAKFEDFPMWGDSIGPEFVLDQKSQMFFPSKYYKDTIQKLWVHKCKVCSHTFRDIKALRAHVTADHNMHICLHCVENKHDFPAEQRCYTQKQYETHLREGDQDGSQGHPNCEFCRKRYYDATALFVHLNKDHYNCHLCEKAGVKFKYFKDYKHMEEHFQKAHILCDDPVCLAKKFIVFDNEIDFEVHNRKYHPTFAIKRASTIKLDFKVARNSNSSNNLQREEYVTKESGEEDHSSANNNHSSNPDHSSGQNRYEGGFGGRARDGEWQVELQPISADPRDINRNAHIVVGNNSAISNSSSENALAEEFPTLPTSTSTGAITLTNKWVSMGTTQGGARRPKKNDFPALQSTKKPTLSSKLGGGSANMGGSGSVSSIQREYDSLGNVTSGSVGTSQRAVAGSLGDWARIKETKKPAKTNITTANTNTSTSSGKAYTGYYSAQSPAVGYEESLAMALAESLTDAYKSTTTTNTINTTTANTTDSDFTTVPTTKPYALPPPPPTSTDAYPTLATTNTTTTKNTNTKKKAPAAGGWNDALLSMGMNTSAKKTVVKNKLSVIKPTSTDNLSKLDTSTKSGASNTSSGKWDTMKPITKTSEDEYRIGSGKASPTPTTTNTNTTNTNTTSTTNTNDKKYGGWVKMGGATNGSVASQIDTTASSADYPSLGGAKRK